MKTRYLCFADGLSRLYQNQNQNQPVLGGGGVPAITCLTPRWNSRSYCFVLGMKTNHCSSLGIPICAASGEF